MLYLSHTPRPPLDEFVECLWLASGGQSPRRDLILPNGTVELVINLVQDQVRIETTMHSSRAQTFSGAVLSGTYSAAFVIDAMQHAAMLGVHFRPGGASAVLGVPSVKFTDAHADLAGLWGDGAARELRERLCTAATHDARFQHLEHVVIQRLLTNQRLNAVIRFALDSFGPGGCGATVREVARTKRTQSSPVPDHFQVRSGTATETVLSYPAVPACPFDGAANSVRQLD